MSTNTNETEIRSLSLSDCEIRADGDDAPKLVGYAAIFNKFAEGVPFFRERVKPGAFSRSLREGADVRALFDHDTGKVLGRTKAGTLSMVEDKRGLKVEITPPDTTTGRDVVESIRRGDLDGMSIGFRVRAQTFSEENKDRPIRELTDIELLEVSVVAFPAYQNTDIGVRSMELWKESQGGDVQSARNRLAIAETA